MFCFKIC